MVVVSVNVTLMLFCMLRCYNAHGLRHVFSNSLPDVCTTHCGIKSADVLGSSGQSRNSRLTDNTQSTAFSAVIIIIYFTSAFIIIISSYTWPSLASLVSRHDYSSLSVADHTGSCPTMQFACLELVPELASDV